MEREQAQAVTWSSIKWPSISLVLFLCLVFILAYFSTKPEVDKSLQLLSIIGTLSTIILGITAIWLSVYLYNLSTNLNSSFNTTMQDWLSRIEKSSSQTEQASKTMNEQVMGVIMNLAQSNTKTVANTSSQLVDRLGKRLDALLNAAPADKEKARAALFEEIDSLLKDLKHELGPVKLIQEFAKPKTADSLEGLCKMFERFTPQPKTFLPQDNFFQQLMASLAEKAENKQTSLKPSDKTKSFIRRMLDIESEHKFVSVKWLREKKFADDPDSQAIMQAAIDKELLLTERIPNPRDPKYPILTCKLNREHQIVKEVLESVEI